MLKKYISKFTIDILPSVLATIIGAYIVNHYIVTKPDAPAAAVASTPEAKKSATLENSSENAGIPGSGVKAKGISEKAMLEKTASERPAAADRSEPASQPAEARHVPPAPRDKPVAKTAQPTEAAASEEKPDATDLARAAIERLRASPEAKVQEAARVPETPRAIEAPRIASIPAVQPLPPPVVVSVPANDTFNPATGSVPAKPYGSAQINDRPTPPADIPAFSRPLDLRADVTEPAPL
jgi:hypothetical protein